MGLETLVNFDFICDQEQAATEHWAGPWAVTVEPSRRGLPRGGMWAFYRDGSALPSARGF